MKERAKQDNFNKSIIAYENELEKMELHTGVSISQAAAAQAHDREQAAAEAQRLAQARVDTHSCS